MSSFTIKGTVTAIGQSRFDNSAHIYAFIEITESTGRRVKIDQVAVCNDVGLIFRMGQSGEFFVDRIFRLSQTFRCQLWGIKADGIAAFDSINLEKRTAVAPLILGIIFIPAAWLGLILAVPALFRLLTSGSSRRKMFYGSDPAEARRLGEQQAVRI